MPRLLKQRFLRLSLQSLPLLLLLLLQRQRQRRSWVPRLSALPTPQRTLSTPSAGAQLAVSSMGRLPPALAGLQGLVRLHRLARLLRLAKLAAETAAAAEAAR